MYEDKLGGGWHNWVRSKVGVKKTILTDQVIEGSVKFAHLMLYASLGEKMMTDPPETPLNQQLYRDAFLYILASILCEDLQELARKIPNGRDFTAKGKELYQKGLAALSQIE
jgi:hypothetical protein